MQIAGDDGVAPQRVAIGITRTVRDLPADLLRDPRTALFQLGFINADARERHVGVTAYNGTAEPVELDSMSAGPIYRTDTAGETTIDGTAALRRVADRCPDPLAPRTTCDLQLTVTPHLGAGKYALEIAVNGAQAGQSVKTVKFEIRASAWLTAFLVMIGAVVGTLVTYWREKGRALVDQLIAVAETRTQLEGLAHAAPTRPTALAARALLDESRKLEGEITRGGDRQTALVDLDKRTVALAKAVTAVRSAKAQPILADLTARIDAIVGQPDWKPEDLDAASGILRAEFEASGDLVDARRAAQTLDDRLRPLVPWITGAQAESYRAFRQARADATDPVSASAQRPAQGSHGAVLASRADHLRELCTALETSQPKAALEALRAAVVEKAGTNPAPPEKPDLDALGRRIADAAAAPSIETAAALVEEAHGLKVSRPSAPRRKARKRARPSPRSCRATPRPVWTRMPPSWVSAPVNRSAASGPGKISGTSRQTSLCSSSSARPAFSRSGCRTRPGARPSTS